MGCWEHTYNLAVTFSWSFLPSNKSKSLNFRIHSLLYKTREQRRQQHARIKRSGDAQLWNKPSPVSQNVHPPSEKNGTFCPEVCVGAIIFPHLLFLGAVAQRSNELLQQHVRLTHCFFDLCRYCLTWFVRADICMPRIFSHARDWWHSQFLHHHAYGGRNTFKL